MSSEKLSQRGSCIHTVHNRKGVLPVRVPEQTLGQMGKTKRDQVRKNRDRGPSVYRVNNDVTSWPCQSRERRNGSFRINKMFGYDS